MEMLLMFQNEMVYKFTLHTLLRTLVAKTLRMN